MIKAQDFKLPVGPKPGWELDTEVDEEEEESELKSVAESFVVVSSLKQSRANWLASTFPKFSSKARGGKASDAVPPPHTIRSLGKCDLLIGPHIFSSTSLYEVHYLPSAPSTLARPPAPMPPAPTWHPSAPYGSYIPYGQHTQPQQHPQYSQNQPMPVAATAPVQQRASTPLVSSVVADTPITSALIQQVNSAAGSDPILANHLQLAASGKATADQLKTLGILIQTLAAGPSTVPPPQTTPINTYYPMQASEQRFTPAPSSAPSTTPTPAPSGLATPSSYASYPYPGHQFTSAPQYIPQPATYPPRDFDIIIEFPEKPNDRWVFPRGAVICERKPASGVLEEINLTTALPFPKLDYLTSKNTPASVQEGEQSPPVVPQEVVTFKFTKVQQTVWDSLQRWSGGSEKLQENRDALLKIKAPERAFLRYQLREGDLLTQLRNAATSPYAMKSIKPAYGDRPRPKRRAPRKAPATPATGEEGTAPAAPKRKKSAAKSNAPLAPVRQIACIACGQTDVPLMLGGRFCRPCVDNGKAQSMLNIIDPPHHVTPAPSLAGPSQPTSLTSAVPGQMTPSQPVHHTPGPTFAIPTAPETPTHP